MHKKITILLFSAVILALSSGISFALNGDVLLYGYKDHAGVTNYFPVLSEATTSTSGTGIIVGLVTNSSGNPIQNVFVEAYDVSGAAVSSAYTDFNGTYSLSYLFSGSYKVFFSGISSGYVDEWYYDALDINSAAWVNVSDNSTTQYIDAVLSYQGSISGIVTDGVNPLQNASVQVYDSFSSYIADAITDSQGRYTVMDVSPGFYKVLFDGRKYIGPPGYISEWYNDVSEFDFLGATGVAVVFGAVTVNINASLSQGGGITGRITDGLNPIQNVSVYAYDAATSTFITSAPSDNSGAYSLVGLSAGSYKVYFEGDKAGYINEWYNNATDFDTAASVSVAVGIITAGIDGSLSPGGSISGSVTDASYPIENVLVSVHDPYTGTKISGASTDAAGYYIISGIPAGIFKVFFYGSDGFNPLSEGFISEWFYDTTDINAAATVVVSVGSVTTNVDAVLDIGGAISGTVTDGGSPLANIIIDVVDADKNIFVAESFTDAAGYYKAKGIPTGTFKVNFIGDYLGYANEWYDDAVDINTASSVPATAPNITIGIDAILVPVSSTFTIIASAGTGGTITPSGAVTVNAGASQTFDLAADAGFKIASLSVDGASITGAVGQASYSYTFTSVAANHSIDVTFTPYVTTYIITASAGAGGTITPSGAVTVNAGASRTFDLAVDAGFKIATLTVDGVSVAGATGLAFYSYTFSNVTADHIINVTFSPIVATYTITASAGTGGAISPSGAVSVNQGDSATFYMSANSGYKIASLTVDGVQISGAAGQSSYSYTFTAVAANHSVNVTFAPVLTTYTLTASAGSGGNISPSGITTLNAGDSLTVFISANAGYKISTLNVDGAAVTEASGLSSYSYTFSNIASNHTIDVAFAPVITTYNIIATSGSGGSISPSGSVSITSGTAQTFNISANSGYRIAALTVDGVAIAGASGLSSYSYAFSNVSSNHTIDVSFNFAVYLITASTSRGGSISPSGAVEVRPGASQTFYITPDSGYKVVDVTVDGRSMGTLYAVTFNNIIDNHSITVTFSR